MASLNKVQIIGHMGRDAELRYTANGSGVTSFSVAVSYRSGEKESTEWFNVSCWNKLAEVCAEWGTKGRQVYVEGRLQTRTYEDKNGVEKKAVDLVANTVLFLDKQGERASVLPTELGDDIDPDSIPFEL